MSHYVDSRALVGNHVKIGEGSRVWANAQIRDNVSIGKLCTIGKDTYLGTKVAIGDNCKIQNGALIYESAQLEDGVFIGPGVILTNDLYPRAINPDGSLKSAFDWNPVGVIVRKGASLGAGTICVAPVEIGKWAMTGAGSVITRNVPNFALMAGVPARQIGWVGRYGRRLIQSQNTFQCPVTGEKFHLVDGILEGED